MSDKIKKSELSPLVQSLISEFSKSEPKPAQELKKTSLVASFGDAPLNEPEQNGLMKSINLAMKQSNMSRLAFESDPSVTNEYMSLYKGKTRLIPDSILKRILIQNSLVATVINTRCNQGYRFGKPQEKRHEIGYKFIPKKGVLERCTPEQKLQLQKEIESLTSLFKTCGSPQGWDTIQQPYFGQYLYMSIRYAIGVGRTATEVIYTTDVMTGEKKFHSFRVIDAGTIYHTATSSKGKAAEAVRAQALSLLEKVKGEKLDPHKYVDGEYVWVQVIEGKPVQAFTSGECLVQNFYPNSDVELDGYPITPIDTVIADVTTNLNITTHNKLYFQNGRAARGMVVVKSNDVTDEMLQRIRQQFAASINSTNSSHRTPLFGLDPADEISWVPLESGTRDMEFSYLADQNIRSILGAFQMAPEEIPSYGYLSRGTSNQGLAESNNEWRLEAARDLGIRPLLGQLEDHINNGILPIINQRLAQLISFKFMGLDADTEEKESIRIQQDAALHYNYNQVLEKVEKTPLPKSLGADYPFNPAYQQILARFLTVGEQKEYFLGVHGASQDPNLAYYPDALWFQWMAVKMQKEEHDFNMEMMKQQAMQPQPPPDQGGDGGPRGGDSEQQEKNAANVNNTAKQGVAQEQESQAQQTQDLARSLEQAIGLLSKSEEDKLPTSERRLLSQHRNFVKNNVNEIEKEMEEALKQIIDQANKSNKG